MILSTLLAPIAPYLEMIKVAAVIAVLVFVASKSYVMGEADVQAKWDKQDQVDTAAREKKTLRDMENSSQADTAITKRIQTEGDVNARIYQKVLNVPVQIDTVQVGTACHVPLYLGLLVNDAATGSDPDVRPATGQPDGQADAPSGPSPKPIE